ncbi:hypothetical protein BDY21DRAFT_19153 [Lineolata rhizophorae]|uniref:Uncharacterized protein n=1 Tax=Lineolata rhizophorae TaxID=578093 RepID=A0A6A6P1N4_9PEZI|nr:hypothetical protein BDY21DRAFT_19153 [Lineolata rhizophorae]
MELGRESRLLTFSFFFFSPFLIWLNGRGQGYPHGTAVDSSCEQLRHTRRRCGDDNEVFQVIGSGPRRMAGGGSRSHCGYISLSSPMGIRLLYPGKSLPSSNETARWCRWFLRRGTGRARLVFFASTIRQLVQPTPARRYSDPYRWDRVEISSLSQRPPEGAVLPSQRASGERGANLEGEKPKRKG